jgi:hypothetical protein
MAVWACMAAHAGLDVHALALGLAAEQGHGQVVGFAAWVDGAADPGNPQPDAKCLKTGKVRENWLP